MADRVYFCRIEMSDLQMETIRSRDNLVCPVRRDSQWESESVRPGTEGEESKRREKSDAELRGYRARKDLNGLHSCY